MKSLIILRAFGMLYSEPILHYLGIQHYRIRLYPKFGIADLSEQDLTVTMKIFQQTNEIYELPNGRKAVIYDLVEEK